MTLMSGETVRPTKDSLVPSTMNISHWGTIQGPREMTNECLAQLQGWNPVSTVVNVTRF